MTFGSRSLGALIAATAAGALALVPLAPAGALSTTSSEPTRYPLGARPTASALAANAFAPRFAAATGAALDAPLPNSVDLSGNAPTAGDQGQVGSCVSWTIGYSIAGYHARSTGRAGAPYAPIFLYSQVNGGRDQGSTTSANYTVIRSQGIAEQRVYPGGQFNWRAKPTTAQKANAAENKAAGSSYLFSGAQNSPAAQTAIKSALAAGSPVALVIPVYQPFFSLGSQTMTPSMATGGLVGYHAIAAFGYDESGVRILNSWGTGWGSTGWGRLSWDFVRSYVVEASVLTGFAPDTQAPAVTALSARTALSTGGSSLTVTGSRVAMIDATDNSAVTLVKADDPAVSWPVTVNVRTSTTLLVTLPQAPAGQYRLVLTNDIGSSADTRSDDLTLVTPFDAVVAQETTALARGGTKVTLTGSGFGTTRAQFTALGLTATVNGARATVAWVSDTAITVTMPRGTAGSTAQVRLWRAGFAGALSEPISYV